MFSSELLLLLAEPTDTIRFSSMFARLQWIGQARDGYYVYCLKPKQDVDAIGRSEKKCVIEFHSRDLIYYNEKRVGQQEKLRGM